MSERRLDFADSLASKEILIEALRAELSHANATLENAEAELRLARLLSLAAPRLATHLETPPGWFSRKRRAEHLFDDELYTAIYPDTLEAVRAGTYKSPYDHWLRKGREEGRLATVRPYRSDVPLYFDEAAYLQHYPEAAAAVAKGRRRSGFDYWVHHGLRQGHRFNPGDFEAEESDEASRAGFDGALYCFFNPDVADAIRAGRISSAYNHWKQHGSFEGRAGGPIEVVEDRRQFHRTLVSRSQGVNLYGFLSSASGLGSLARGAAKALESRAIPLQTLNIPAWSSGDVKRQTTLSDPYRVNLILQNADMMGRFLRSYGKEILHGSYNIGYWLWELPSARMDWASVYRYVDEVWVASEYCRHAFQTLTQIPVTRIPLVVDGLDSKATFSRDHFGFPKDVFVFCYIYDISSQLERKNPRCLIEAFKREFGGSSMRCFT
ncbi:MAG: hypothetical protein WKF37_10770 [Bryobacteraceae bacterium]